MRLLRKELSLLKERTQSVGGVVVFSELCLVSSTLRQASFAYIYIYIYILHTCWSLINSALSLCFYTCREVAAAAKSVA